MKKVKNILFSIFAFGCLIHVWYYAVGGFSVWGKGKAKVWKNGQCFSMRFQFKFADRYNWDNGKDVKIKNKTITDEEMGEFHRQGIAKEFNMHGEVTESLSWKKSEVAL